MENVVEHILGILPAAEDFFRSVWNTGGVVSWTGALIFLFVLALWSGSGFLAATIAELFDRPVSRHFALGLLLPYIYPALLAGRISKARTAQEREVEYQETEGRAVEAAALNDRLNAMRGERRAERRRRIVEQHLAATGEELTEEQLDAIVPENELEAPREDFAKKTPETAPPNELARQIHDALFALDVDPDGVRHGNFQLFTDGGIVEICEIKSMRDDFMICTLSGSGKTMRIRYDKLNGVEES